ncbi:MAG: FkbM family methyltransferase [Bacteroidetes bacterium]|nr:FkbM family methyltransferase [Bacteroidota bacterium]
MKAFVKRILSGFGLYVSPGYTNYFFGNRKIVKRNIYGSKVLMPKSHSITYNLSHFPYYNTNLQRITQQYQQFRKERFSIVDVGANIGDTLLMLRQVTEAPVHCFEGDPFYFDLLKKNSAQIKECYIHNILLSDKPVSVKVKNESALGTSKFVADAEGGTSLDFSSIDHFFEKNFSNEKIGIIKTDTDGYDLKILKGAENILRRHHPVIFLEYDRTLFEKNNDDGITFLNYLQDLDYNGILVYDNYGKLICITELKEKKTILSLHAYIKNQKITFPFYDLAIFAAKDGVFFNSFSNLELNFFEK